MEFKATAVLVASLLLTSSVVNGFLEAADYSDYREEPEAQEDTFEDLGDYDPSPYGDYSDFFHDDSSLDIDSKDQYEEDGNEALGELSTDYEGGGQEPDDLDTFFWTDHLDKFGGSAVKTTKDTQIDKKGQEEEEPETVPEPLKTQVDIVTWWIRGTEFHKDYWPVKVNLSHDRVHLISQLQRSLSTPEGWLKERFDPDWPHLKLTAKEFIPADEIIMAMPMTVAVAPDGVASADKFSVPEDLGPAIILAAWLLRERAKGEDSEWAAYLKLLPERVPLPFLWTDEQLEAFDFGPIVRKIKDQAQFVDSMYLRLDSSFLAEASLQQFENALSVVWSRQVLALPTPEGIPWQSNKGSGTDFTEEEPLTRHFLAPLGDFIETRFHGKASWQVKEFDEGEFLCLVADSDIDEGEAIQVTTEGYDTTQFLMHRGTVPQGNSHDEFVVFGPTEQVINYFAENFIKEESVPQEHESVKNWSTKGISAGELVVARERFKGRALKVAEEVVNLVMPFQGELPPPLTFGPRGFVDPRLWAVYAVCSYFKEHLQRIETAELNVPLVARLATDLSNQQDGLTCSTLAEHARKEFPTASEERIQDAADSVAQASFFLQQLASVWLEGFSTSLEDDQKRLAESKQCLCEGDDLDDPSMDTDPGQCPPSCVVKFISREQELAIRFQMNRKHLLISVLEHLHEVCRHHGSTLH